MTTLVLSMLRGPAGVAKQTRYVSSGMFEIGRAPSSDWVIDDPECFVSKRQCVFRQDEAGWLVADMSRNGSFMLRGGDVRRLGPYPHRLSAGERLRFGSCEIAIDFEEDEASFRTLTSAGGHEAPMSSPPDIPPSETVRDWAFPAERPRGAAPIRPWPQDAWSPADALTALLEGASLGRADVEAAGREREVLRRAGASLRTMVGEIRALRLLMLGEPGQRRPGAAENASAPLVEAANERDALRWLLDPARGTDRMDDDVVAAAFGEFRQHHEYLVRAARQAMRALFELLDPDEPERQMLPHWLDLVPGGRRARSAVLARRRYRRMREMLGQTIDQMLARAYWDVHREQDPRWNRR